MAPVPICDDRYSSTPTNIIFGNDPDPSTIVTEDTDESSIKRSEINHGN